MPVRRSGGSSRSTVRRGRGPSAGRVHQPRAKKPAPDTVRRGRGPSAKKVIQPRVTEKAVPPVTTVRRGRGPTAGKKPQPVLVRTGGGKTKTLSRKRYRKTLRTQRKLAYQRYLESKRTGGRNVGSAKPYRSDDIELAGLNISDIGSELDRRAFPKGTKLRVLTAPVQVARAAKEDPGGVATGTLKGLRDSIVGLPSAAVKAVSDPEGALKDIAEDYERRYGPLVEGNTRKFRERIKKEGAAGEAFDALGVAGVGGRVAGSAARTAGAKVMTEPRPKLRTSGGKAREQDVSNNLITAVAQRKVDKRRTGKTIKAKRKAAQGGRIDALDEAVGTGEVAPLRMRKGRQGREVAKRKSRGVQAMKGEQAREVTAAGRAIGKLDKRESSAFKYAQQLGIRDAGAGTTVLATRRKQIVAERRASGVTIPKALEKTNDELRTIDRILESPERYFTPKLAKVAEGERRRSRRVAKGDPGLTTEQRMLRTYAPLAEALGIKRVDDESARSFAVRVRREAKRKGLDAPAYFRSEKRPTVRYADYAIGGAKATARDKEYTGALFRTGRESTDPQVHLDSLARNIKRKHNWNTVADNAETNVFSWGKNKTVGGLLDEMDRRGIDPASVAFWSPGKFHAERTKRGDADEIPDAEDFTPQGLDKAVDAAFSTRLEDFDSTARLSAIPKGVFEEIHADTRPSGALGRSWDVAKGKQSRYLLGTNPPWLMFQVGSNALLTGMAKTGPIDAVKAQIWWKNLDPKLREAVEPYVGVGPTRVDTQQAKLGAAANNGLVNGYRAWKQSPMGRRLGRVSPARLLDAMFQADAKQNNFFRRSVLYSQAKRDAYASMSKNTSLAMRAQGRLAHTMTLGPKKQLDEILRNPERLERHARYVNDMLGDYMTFSAKERRTLGRGVMFYGFLRFSLRFTFYTMPARHPAMTAILGNLARMQTEEVRRILGGDELPFALGKLYLTGDGKLKEINLGRLNPASNALVDAANKGMSGGNPLSGAIGMLPPVVQTALDLAFSRSSFAGRPLRVRGEHTFAANAREAAGLGIRLDDQGRIVANRMLSLFYPYRVAGEVVYGDQPQGDDSLPFDQRPTTYKDEEIRGNLAKQRRRADARGLAGTLKEQALPFLPKPSRDPETAKSIRERRAALNGTTKKKSNDPLGLSGSSSDDDPLGLKTKSTESDPLGLLE